MLIEQQIEEMKKDIEAALNQTVELQCEVQKLGGFRDHSKEGKPLKLEEGK